MMKRQRAKELVDWARDTTRQVPFRWKKCGLAHETQSTMMKAAKGHHLGCAVERTKKTILLLARHCENHLLIQIFINFIRLSFYKFSNFCFPNSVLHLPPPSLFNWHIFCKVFFHVIPYFYFFLNISIPPWIPPLSTFFIPHIFRTASSIAVQFPSHNSFTSPPY